MRENWDFVSFATYKADTAELANQSASVITDLRRQNDALKHTIWAMTIAAGGKVKVPDNLLHNPRGELCQWYDEYNMSFVLDAKPVRSD